MSGPLSFGAIVTGAAIWCAVFALLAFALARYEIAGTLTLVALALGSGLVFERWRR